MKVRIYTDKELEILNENIFIEKINYKREIVYDPVFKLWTIMMRLERPDLSAKEIFALAGFDTNILSPKIPRDRIKEWKEKYKKYGVRYFLPITDSYSSLEKDITNPPTKDFKSNLLFCVLKRLEGLEID